MSVVKWLYLFILRSCALSILVSKGTVSSKMSTVFFASSIITMSGFSAVTQRLGGIVPLEDVEKPGMSL